MRWEIRSTTYVWLIAVVNDIFTEKQKELNEERRKRTEETCTAL